MRVAHPIEKKKLGELLVELDLLSEEQLQAALMIHRKTAKRLGQIFVEENMISEDVLIEVLSKQLGYTHVWLRKGLIDPKIVKVIQKGFSLLVKALDSLLQLPLLG